MSLINLLTTSLSGADEWKDALEALKRLLAIAGEVLKRAALLANIFQQFYFD